MGGKFQLSDVIAIEQSLYGRPSRGWSRVDAVYKIVIAVAAILANVIVARVELSAALLVVSLIIVAVSRVPLNHLLFFLLAPAWATLIVMAGFAVGFGQTPVVSIGPLTVTREGLWLGLSAGMRVACDMAWLAALFLTTPFDHILKALRRLRVPPVLVDTLNYMYRYLFLLWDEFFRLSTAARSRGGYADRKRSLGTIGMIAAQIFLRAYDRAQRIYISSLARGGA